VLLGAGCTAGTVDDRQPGATPDPVLGTRGKPLADTLSGRVVANELVVTVRDLDRGQVEALAEDAADALGVAICHAHTAHTQARLVASGRS